MKFVALVSGGKDSIYSILECQKNGHELVACVHLGAPQRQNSAEEEEESYMYQSAASEVLPTLVEECLGVPLILHVRVGKSANTSLVYDQDTLSDNDEVEDMYVALQKAKSQFPEIQAVSSGAILSTYQRVRVEHVCSRLGLTSLSYLWRRARQDLLLQNMLEDGIDAVLVKVACPPGLKPYKHLNQSLRTLYDSGHLQKLHDMYQFHMCGEGGEYESLVVDCPLYTKKLVLDEVDICVDDDDDGVGVLVVKRSHAAPKEMDPMLAPQEVCSKKEESSATKAINLQTSSKATRAASAIRFLPRVRQVSGGLLHVSEIIAPAPAVAVDPCSSEAKLAEKEASDVLQTLQFTLQSVGATAQDVVMVHLYLSEILHFANINAHYRDCFGTLLPPSRSCVAVGRNVLPGGRRVLLDCMVQLGSGAYLRRSLPTSSIKESNESPYAAAAGETTTSSLRDVLHVQSLSYWAPVCVGPYSQVNTLRSGLHLLAGQIGLIPASMKLRRGWKGQLEQCWTNVANVLDALDGTSCSNILSCLIYVSSPVVLQHDDVWKTIETITRKQLSCNGGVTPGAVDSAVASEAYDGYEDEETWKLETQQDSDTDQTPWIPLLFVSIPEMPVGAQVEVEVTCASRRAADCLGLTSTSVASHPVASESRRRSVPLHWDTGHDFATGQALNLGIQLNASLRSLGTGCAAMAVISASMDNSPNSYPSIDTERLLLDMMSSLDESSGLTSKDILHVRLYYVAASLEDRDNNDDGARRNVTQDGVQLQTALQSMLARSRTNPPPASTAVPVQAIEAMHSEGIATSCFLAMQILLIDPMHMETEIWIRHGRPDE